MDAIRAALSGRKTYVIAAVYALIAVLEGYLDVDVPGINVAPDEALQMILEAAGLSTLRRGVAKTR